MMAAFPAISVKAGVSEITTGEPQAIASMTGSPKPSYVEMSAVTEAAE